MKRRQRSQDTFSVSGWLFADLLLGIAMLFFVFNTVGEAPTTPTPTATYPPTCAPSWTPSTTPTNTPSPTPTETPTPTRTPTRTPTPSKTPTPLPTRAPTRTPTPVPYEGGLNKQYVEIKVKTNMTKLLAGDEDEVERVRGALRKKVEGRLTSQELTGAEVRAGLVLTFGYTTNDELSNGILLSSAINNLLTRELPELFDKDWTVFKDYLSVADDRDPVGTVRMEIYWNIE